MDTGQVLAGRDMYAAHPPASTIKTLLALTALDEVPFGRHGGGQPGRRPRRSATVRVWCATYTARQLLDAVLLVSGNDAANTLAELLGGFDTAVAKMNAKAVAIGATNTTPPRRRVSTVRRVGLDHPHDLAAIFRAAMANPVFAEITAQPAAMFPTDTGERPLINQDELLVRYPGRSAARPVHRRRPQDVRGRRRPRRLTAGHRDDVRAGREGGLDLLGSGRDAARLGFRAEPVGKRRNALDFPVAAGPTVRVEPGMAASASEMPGVGLARSFGVATMAASFSVDIGLAHGSRRSRSRTEALLREDRGLRSVGLGERLHPGSRRGCHGCRRSTRRCSARDRRRRSRACQGSNSPEWRG